MDACARSDIQVQIDSFADKEATPQGRQNVHLASDESRLRWLRRSNRPELTGCRYRPEPRRSTIFSATRQAFAMIVRVGLAPVPVGNGEPSTA